MRFALVHMMALGALLVGCSARDTPRVTALEAERASPRGGLASVGSFGAIEDGRRRSAAIFTEMSKALLHPRCVNCHPTDDRPRQGLAQELHEPPVWRGPENSGAPGLHCGACHGDSNSSEARVPGAPGWHLAPLEMGWMGLGAAEVCAQLKDNARNGGASLDQIHEHVARDPLVAWAWEPGHDREPAPGSQALLAALTRAWIDSGAACPETPGGTP